MKRRIRGGGESSGEGEKPESQEELISMNGNARKVKECMTVEFHKYNNVLIISGLLSILPDLEIIRKKET